MIKKSKLSVLPSPYELPSHRGDKMQKSWAEKASAEITTKSLDISFAFIAK